MPADWLGLSALVFVLGLRHGLDPDHLVAIDGLARSSRSRWCGLFFALGHGAVVTVVGLTVALAAADWHAPAWLEQLGAWISIGVLLALGSANLVMLARTPGDQVIAPLGLRGRWLLERLGGNSHPMMIASVGAAFALSFDTISHALLFSISGASMAGWAFALASGLVFTLGMMLTDGMNGWWVATMICGAERRSAGAARAISTAIVFLCFALAAAAMTRYTLPKLLLSAATLLVIGAAYLAAMRLARPARSV